MIKDSKRFGSSLGNTRRFEVSRIGDSAGRQPRFTQQRYFAPPGFSHAIKVEDLKS